MKEILEYSLIAVVMVLIGLGVGYFLRKNIAEGKLNQAEQEAARIIANGERTAESKKKEALLEAKEEIHKLRSDVERENKDRRSELQRMERRILQKEESLDKKLDNIEHKEEALHRKEADLAQSREKVEALYEKQMAELERISGMTFEEAKNILLTNVEQEIRHETAIMVKEMEQQAKDEAEKKAKEIISSAIQRCAADHVAETTVSVVALPNDEMKGRIIGREGRNIRALETLTGIDLIIDDTPEAAWNPSSANYPKQFAPGRFRFAAPQAARQFVAMRRPIRPISPCPSRLPSGFLGRRAGIPDRVVLSWPLTLLRRKSC